MNKSEVEKHLSSFGFTNSPSRLGDTYSLPLETGMQITAYASFVGSLFAPSDDTYGELIITLESRGTRYKFRSLAGLQKHFPEVLNTLRTVSKTPDLLKCPKCGIRFVHAKEPTAGQKWKPFLSCDGMMIQGKGAKKRPACDGVSKKLPAVVAYR